jgi:uncharacterized protein
MEKTRKSDFKQCVCLKIMFILVLPISLLNCSSNNLDSDVAKGSNLVGRSYVINKKSDLWKYIDTLKVIDTHEHIDREADLLGLKLDVFDMMIPYVIDNLQSAGMTRDEMKLISSKESDFKEKWDAFYKYYPFIKNTTYFLALHTALEDQCQLKSVSMEEFQRVSNLLTQDFAEKGFFKKFMDRNKIESMLSFRSCSLAEVRKSFGENNVNIVPTVSLIQVRDANSLENISRMTEMPIRNLDDILKGIDHLLSEYNALGIKNLKFGNGYYRELNFHNRTREEAESAFARIMRHDPGSTPTLPNTLSPDQTVLDDYLAVYIISLASKYKMNVIFHCGLTAWNNNYVKYSHTSGMEWLFTTFPDVNFVLLHAGYPFFDEAMLLAKYYPNVYINMTWDHIIDREKSINIMKSYIEMLPTNKIHAFGGDYFYPQQIAGHLKFAKENIYFAFNDLIKKGIMTIDEAKKVIYDWLYANPKAFYFK